MKPESRLEIIERYIAVAENLVKRQAQIVVELEERGSSTEQAIILLAHLHSSLQAFRDALARMKADGP